MIRIEAARDSYPYEAVSGAHEAWLKIQQCMTCRKCVLTSPPSNRL